MVKGNLSDVEEHGAAFLDLSDNSVIRCVAGARFMTLPPPPHRRVAGTMSTIGGSSMRRA